MKRIVVFLFLSGAVSAWAQSGGMAAIQKDEIRAVLELFNNKKFLKIFRFVDQPLKPTAMRYIKEIDSLYKLFSSEDMAYFEWQINNYKPVTFDTSYLNDANFLNAGDFEKLFSFKGLKEDQDPWPVFHEKYGAGYCLISFPLFNKAGDLCIFYSESSVGGLGGDGSFDVYKKVKKKWKLFRHINGWSS